MDRVQPSRYSMLAGQIYKTDYIPYPKFSFGHLSREQDRTIGLLVIDRHIRIAFDAV
jgi:hypothetical protein